MKILLFIAILIPQIATAGVFMCVDPVTGKKSFTDRACPKSEAGTRVKVEPSNFGANGHQRAQQNGQKAWHSQRDTTVSGRNNYLEKTTAVSEPVGSATSPTNEVSS
jgi:hypothetical protein